MATVIKMPQLGESVAEGTIGRWLKQPGDRVERDEPLVEIQTDKVNAEVPSPVAGFLQQILLPEGTTAAVKTDMAVIGDEPPSGDAPQAPPLEAKPTAQGPEGTTTTRTFSYDTSASGGVVGHRGEEPSQPSLAADGAAAAHQPAASGPSASSVPSSSVDRPPTESEAAPGGKRFYTPVVLRMAEEHGIDLANVQGSGTMGRVTRKDVERAIAAGSASATTPGAPSAPSTAPPGEWVATPFNAPNAVAMPSALATPLAAEDRPLSPMRKAIAQHMAESRRDIPDAWSLVEIDVTRLVRYRANVLPQFQASEGYELTYLPFFIKAVVAALHAVPELNATWAGDHIRVHNRYDLGIAVSLENGLIVPVLRQADQLSITGIARALRALVQKARSGKLGLDDLQGATFTVNNPGSLGSIMSQPIVPVGQAGIVTMEKMQKRPVVTADDAIAIRSMMNSCLSFDHRILDGAQALRFLHTLKQQLETVEYPLY